MYRTPLHIAVSDNQELAVDFLLQRGARTDVLDRWGRTPMDCAIEIRSARILQLVERVHFASTAMGVSKDALLGDRYDAHGRSPGGAGGAGGGGGGGSNGNNNNNNNHSSVSEGMRRSRSTHDLLALFQAVRDGDTEKVKRVWLEGLELNSVDDLGRTSLHVAVEKGQLGVIELLLSADVDTNVLDASGRTPISIALEKRLFGIAEMIRAHQKAKTSIQAQSDEDQRYVAHAFTATKRGDLNELRRWVPDIVHPDVQDYDLRTLLHIASAEGHVDVAKYLVGCGANVNLLDRWGTSPLSEAVDFAHNKLARFLIANHATESGNRTAIAVDHIDNMTLTTALEFALRVVTRKRWLMGQVFCPMKDESDACVLVAHSVWHKNDKGPLRRRSSSDDMDSSFYPPPSTATTTNTSTSALSAASVWNDPIQMFRKVGSMMMIDPGQGHTGRVFSGQHPEWLNLNNVQQNHLFLLPHARRAGIQTVISVPMIYKLSTIAVLSWYSYELIPEDPEELQRIQCLLRSITILATLRQELLSAEAAPSGTFHIPRFQYCQSLDNAITANGELLEENVDKEHVTVDDTLPLALEWGLFDFIDKLATSMSSEDHAVIVPLLRSLITLLRRGFFEGVFDETTQEERDRPQESILCECNGAVRTRWTLLVHVRYYLMYLHSVSPTEGTIFIDVDRLIPTMNKYFAGEDVTTKADDGSTPKDAHMTESVPVSTPKAPEKECVLCKFNVPGHIHPGKAPASGAQPKKPVFTSTSKYSAGENFFGTPGNPHSPVFREIQCVRGKMELEYDNFERKGSLVDNVWEGTKSASFTTSDLYDAIGSSHDPPSRKSGYGAKSDTPDSRKGLLQVVNEIMEDTSCLITLEQVMSLHSSLFPDANEQGGAIRSTAAVGYASPRIYRVFLPVGEIRDALRQLVVTINDADGWSQRPLLCAYYAFAILVFYIHPFHDGNGRCGRLLGNIIAKKLGYPAIFRAADKTIQVTEFLHKAIVTMEIIKNSRRQNRQSRLLSSRKENSSMWF